MTCTTTRQAGPTPDARNRYDWAMIQRYHDQGNSVRACQGRFGFSLNSWFKARKRGSIASRGMPKKSIDGLARNRSNRGNIKRRLSERGVLPYVCAICGISQWQGRPLTLQIDHVNGKRLDYRLDNLRLLCANCHARPTRSGVEASWHSVAIPVDAMVACQFLTLVIVVRVHDREQRPYRLEA